MQTIIVPIRRTYFINTPKFVEDIVETQAGSAKEIQENPEISNSQQNERTIEELFNDGIDLWTNFIVFNLENLAVYLSKGVDDDHIDLRYDYSHHHRP